MDGLTAIQNLVKALEAGGYDARPGSLVQGAALQVEDLSPVMYNTTFQNEHIKLQKMMDVEDCKSTLWQFDRQLSYGDFGGSAQLEGAVGQEETSQFVRVVVPMCYYSHTRRVTLAANMVATVDGKKAEERAASDAAMKIAGDIEFDLFRGKGDFSNAGVFDGNPLAIAELPNILGLDSQIRQSDLQSNARDLMFAEYGSDLSQIVVAGGVLTQSVVEDCSLRSALNFGAADKLMMDPQALSAFNKIAFNKERIVLAGSPQEGSGADLKRQWVSGGTVSLESSNFLRAKYKPARARSNGPSAPTIANGQSAGTTAFTVGQVYTYYVTTVNEVGESAASATTAPTISTAGNYVTITITPPGSGTSPYFNVYRSAPGGGAAGARFIGRIKNSGAATTVFTDLGNKSPGFITGYLVEGGTFEMRQLAAYSRMKLAVTDLTTPEAHFRFCTLAVPEPRKNVICENLSGTF